MALGAQRSAVLLSRYERN